MVRISAAAATKASLILCLRVQYYEPDNNVERHQLHQIWIDWHHMLVLYVTESYQKPQSWLPLFLPQN